MVDVERLAELAKEAALDHHYDRVKQFDSGRTTDRFGHDDRFDICPHEDCRLVRAHLSAPVAKEPCPHCGEIAVVVGNETRYYDTERCTVPIATAAVYDSLPCGEALPCSAHPVADPFADQLREAIMDAFGPIDSTSAAPVAQEAQFEASGEELAAAFEREHPNGIPIETWPPPVVAQEVTAQPSTDEYYRLKIQRNALTLLRTERVSEGAELATINDMIAGLDVLIGRNRCFPSAIGRHSDSCDGGCGKEVTAREDAPDVLDDRAYYTTDDMDIDPQGSRLCIFSGENGDWYVGIQTKYELNPGRCVRVVTSGSRLPRLAVAIAQAYREIRGEAGSGMAAVLEDESYMDGVAAGRRFHQPDEAWIERAARDAGGSIRKLYGASKASQFEAEEIIAAAIRDAWKEQR